LVFSPDFQEFLQALNDNGAEFVVVGGYAVIHYGHVRATGDLDLFVNATLENSGRVLAALNDFGWSDPALEPDYFAQPGNMYIMGRPPVRIDLITRIDGLDFETVYRDRVVDVVDGLSLGFVSLEHLRTNKLASGRNKDLGDVDALPEA
jgi:predicted nucleotidyltransferase